MPWLVVTAPRGNIPPGMARRLDSSDWSGTERMPHGETAWRQ